MATKIINFHRENMTYLSHDVLTMYLVFWVMTILNESLHNEMYSVVFFASVCVLHQQCRLYYLFSNFGFGGLKVPFIFL